MPRLHFLSASPPRVTAIIYGNNIPWNGGGEEADEKWACSQHVYIAYTMAGENRSFLKRCRGEKRLLGLIGKGDSPDGCSVSVSFSRHYRGMDSSSCAPCCCCSVCSKVVTSSLFCAFFSLQNSTLPPLLLVTAGVLFFLKGVKSAADDDSHLHLFSG